MTTTGDLEGALQQLVAGRLHVPREDVALDSDIVADLGLESLEVVSFLLEVEQLYPPVAFDSLMASELRSLRDLAAYIVALQRE